MIRRLVFIFIFIFSGSSLVSQSYLNKLSTPAEFNKLKGEPLTNKYGIVEAVKVVYDLKTKKIYYINNRRYKLHYTFCSEVLNSPYDVVPFNTYNYSASHPNKRYLLGNVNYYPSDRLYSLEISPIDKMKLGEIQILFDAVKASSYFKKYKLFLNTVRLQKLKRITNLPVVTPLEVYGNQTYQAISKQTGYGVLRFVDADKIEKLNISKKDILVIDKPILDLPMVAGLITNNLQTPLSHISILGKNRKIPIAAYTKIYKLGFLKKLQNKLVSFEVKSDTFIVKEIPIKAYFAKTRQKKKPMFSLKKNTDVKTLLDVKNISAKSIAVVGGKAANFGELYKLSKRFDFKVPEGAFAIPFYFYEQHIKSSNAADLIMSVIYDCQKNSDLKNLPQRLKAIRDAINKAPLNKNLLSDIENKIKQSGYKRMRFRSSTNAEDIVGFSGAGLYSSKTGILGDTTKTIERAVKKVWASLWKEKAFLERNYFNIYQYDVAMGILVHRSFPNEKANGVAITKNLYRESYFGNTINVQLGEVSVVKPKPGVTCDQVICYAGSDIKVYEDVTEIVSVSNINNGKLVLTDAQIVHLSKQLQHVKTHFYNKIYKKKKSFLDFALDIEFKIDGPANSLYFKQARYFND